MNIWQDSNNAVNNSIPNSSTASEKELLKSSEIIEKYSDYLEEEQIIRLKFNGYYFKKSDWESLNKFQNETDTKGN